MDDWDIRSEKPEMIRDYANREQPALQEYDWVREQRQERRVPIGIVEALLASMDAEDAPFLPN